MNSQMNTTVVNNAKAAYIQPEVCTRVETDLELQASIRRHLINSDDGCLSVLRKILL